MNRILAEALWISQQCFGPLLGVRGRKRKEAVLPLGVLQGRRFQFTPRQEEPPRKPVTNHQHRDEGNNSRQEGSHSSSSAGHTSHPATCDGIYYISATETIVCVYQPCCGALKPGVWRGWTPVEQIRIDHPVVSRGTCRSPRPDRRLSFQSR